MGISVTLKDIGCTNSAITRFNIALA